MREVTDRALAENLEAFCTHRAHMYRFLSRCFEVEIDADFAREIADEFSLVSEDGELVESFALLREEVKDLDEQGLEKLAVLFNRAFFGMGPKTAQKAFPYESVYTSAEGIMMQEAFARTVKAYQEAHCAKNPEFPEPEDHVAVQLAFMACLCEKSAGYLREDDLEQAERSLQEQIEFLETHLLNWIEPFLTDLKESVEEGFYWHLASFTLEFLVKDDSALNEVMG